MAVNLLDARAHPLRKFVYLHPVAHRSKSGIGLMQAIGRPMMAILRVNQQTRVSNK